MTIPRCWDFSSLPFPSLPLSSSSSSSSSSSGDDDDNDDNDDDDDDDKEEGTVKLKKGGDHPALKIRNLGQAFLNGSSATPVTNQDENQEVMIGTNTSRNPLIDSVVKPGPYRELLPCLGLCHDLIQACPTALKFSCPDEGTLARRVAYGLPFSGSTNFGMGNGTLEGEDGGNGNGDGGERGGDERVVLGGGRGGLRLACNFPGAMLGDIVSGGTSLSITNILRGGGSRWGIAAWSVLYSVTFWVFFFS